LLWLADLIGTRPFMIMADGGLGPDDFAMTSTVWHQLRGWRRFVSLVGTTHGSYTDHETLLNQLAAAGRINSAAPWVATIPAERAVTAERAHIRAFFDRCLRGRTSHLLDGPSAEYPKPGSTRSDRLETPFRPGGSLPSDDPDAVALHHKLSEMA
jgi:hypothetical protein